MLPELHQLFITTHHRARNVINVHHQPYQTFSVYYTVFQDIVHNINEKFT